MDRRNPWLAVALSILLPGLGHFYAGRAVRGAAWLAGSLLAWAAVLSWLLSESRVNLVEAASLLLIAVAIDWGSWIDVYFIVRGSAGPRGRWQDRPAFAAALSVLLPGLGQLYVLVRLRAPAGATGLFYLGALVAASLGTSLEAPLVPGWPGWLMRWPAWLGVLAGAAITAAAAAHAYVLGFAGAGCRPLPPRSSPPLVAAVILALVVAELPYLIREKIASFRIPSSSMEPALKVGDRLLARRTGEIQRGDIVVFRPPHNPDVDYIKRVVGMPGERISLRGKRVFVDGRELQEPFAVWRDPNGPGDFGPNEVPAGSYFLMGDNRSHSLDSRFFGAVPRSSIFGRAYKRFFPFSRAGPLSARKNLARARSESAGSEALF